MAVGYPDGTSTFWHVNDQNGTSLNQASAGSTWLNRCADISMGGAEQVAPSSLSVVVDSTTGAGSWSIYYGDMSITSTNGTVTQINLGSASQLAVQGAGISGTPTANWETLSETNDPTSAQIAATHYLATDHLGSSQMEFSQGGWPVASKQFGPYGAELNSQTTLDHYKFTGKERDAESGLDYFGARYFGSETGRFMSPDWAAKAEPVPYAKLADPQTLNLYAYAGNNPMSNRDADGHIYNGSCDTAESATCKPAGRDEVGIPSAIQDGWDTAAESFKQDAINAREKAKNASSRTYRTLAAAQKAAALADFRAMVSAGVHQEWGNFTYETSSGTFSFTSPQIIGPPCAEDASACDGTISITLPSGTTLVGDQHSHPWVGDDHQFDGDIINMITEGRKFYGYVSGPSSNASPAWRRNPNVFKLDPNPISPSVCKVSGPSKIPSC